MNIYANQHRNNPNIEWFPTFDIQNLSEVVQTQVAQNRGLTLDIIIPDVCQVPVSMLSFSRVGLVLTFCSTCILINVVKLSLSKYI